MKKIIYLSICVLLVICFSAAVCSASAEVMNEETAEAASVEAEHTVITRLIEYVMRYKTEIIAVAGDAAIALVLFVVTRILKKNNASMSSELRSVRGDTGSTRKQQDAVVGAMNGLIGAYNGMQQSYERYEGVEDDRNRLIGAVMVQNTAILDMLQTVYANSKHLPQGVKDIVTLKYANTLKALDDDEVLRAVVQSVHEKVSGADSTVGVETEGESV